MRVGFAAWSAVGWEVAGRRNNGLLYGAVPLPPL